MPLFVWISLAVFVIGFVAGSIWLTVNALRAWRRGWPVVRQVSSAVDELPPKVVVLERRVSDLEPRLAELQRSVASLSRSVARAKLMLEVVLEAKTAYGIARVLLRFAK